MTNEHRQVISDALEECGLDRAQIRKWYA